MAKQTLPTNYKDDVLATSMGKKRRYNLIQNDDGTISLEDATEYTQVGDNYGAAQLNATNQAVNESVDQAKIIDSLDDISANTQPGMVAGALAVDELDEKIANKMYRTKVLLQYYDSRWMYTTINVGKQFAGTVPIVSLVYQSGSAIPNAINVSAEQVKDDGNVTIWAYGSGFLSAHVLYAMIDCRSD